MLCLAQRVPSQWLIVTHCDVVLLCTGSALVYVTSLAWQMWHYRVSMVGNHVSLRRWNSASTFRNDTASPFAWSMPPRLSNIWKHALVAPSMALTPITAV